MDRGQNVSLCRSLAVSHMISLSQRLVFRHDTCTWVIDVMSICPIVRVLPVMPARLQR